MKQIVYKPHLNFMLLTLWLYFKLFPNFLSGKSLIIIVNSGKINIKILSPVPQHRLYKKSQCVYLLSYTSQENMAVLHYQMLTLLDFKCECEIYEKFSLQ